MIRRRSPAARPRMSGLTLIETMITITLMAIMLSLAVPSMADFIARKRVEGVANEVLNVLQYARGLSTIKSRWIYITFRNETGASGKSCYTVHDFHSSPTGCDCLNYPSTVCSTMTNTSTQATAFNTVEVPNSTGVTLTPSIGQMQYGLDGLPANRMTMDVRVTSTRGGELRVITTETGLSRICSPNGWPGYQACPTVSPAP